jgi:hypothetical protein
VTGVTLPREKVVHAVEFAPITEEDRKKKIFHTLRTIRTNTRYRGRREKKARDNAKAKE